MAFSTLKKTFEKKTVTMIEPPILIFNFNLFSVAFFKLNF